MKKFLNQKAIESNNISKSLVAHRYFKMSFMFKMILSVFIILNHISCYDIKIEKDHIEKIPLVDLKNKIETIDFNLVKIVRLEYSTNSIIGNVRKVEFFNNNIIIQNQRGGGQLLFFNQDGSYLGSIDQQGKGPGEYLEIRDFAINAEKKELLILDKNDRVHFFDFNYNFTKTININKEFDHRRISTKDDYIYTSIYSNDGRNLCISNLKGKYLKSLFPSPRETFGVGRPFDATTKSINMKVKACDTIYELLDDKPLPRILLDFGDKALPHTIAMKTTVRNGVPKNIKYIMNTKFFETSTNYLFNIITYNFQIENESDFIGFYDKDSKETKIFKQSEFVNEIMPNGIYVWSTFDDKYYCTVLYPPLLNDYYNNLLDSGVSITGNYGLLKSLCGKFSIESNPIIVLFQINNKF